MESAMSAPNLSRVNGFQPGCVVPLSESRLAFAAGKLVVEMDLESKAQRFVQGHSALVTCMAHSEQQALGASGQVCRAGAKWAEVLLWDSDSLEVCACFSYHQADVEAIAFIQDGEVLVTVGSDRDKTMALWPAAREGVFRIGRKEGVPLAVSSAFKDAAVSGVVPAPGGSELPLLFASFGVKHIKFWHSARSARLSAAIEGRRGAFGCDGAPEVILCAAWVARDRLVAGGNAGEVFFFHGSRAVRKMQLQSSPVACLLPLKEALAVVHGSGMCHLLNFGKAQEVDFSAVAGWPGARFRTQLVSGSWKDRTLLLSSKTHLMSLDFSNGLHQTKNCQVLISQPSAALTSVAIHPVEPRLYVSALDGLVRCYDAAWKPLESQSLKASAGVTCLALSGAASEDSSAWLAVGCSDSTLSILSEKSHRYVLRRSLSGRKARLTCAKFSAVDVSGAHPLWLAVGTDDGCIHTFRFKEPTCRSSVYTTHTGEEIVSKVATLRGHEAPIFDICFADTLPCTYLIGVDLSGKELAFDVPMARRLPTIAMVREVPFSPWTAPTGWQVQGCQGAQASAGALRRFHEIPGRQAIAVADSEKVEIFPFPCSTPPGIHPPRLEGPAAPISTLLFSNITDSLLATADTVLFEWSWTAQAPRMPLTPLRSVQGMSETPESRKPQMPAFTPPPRARSSQASRAQAKEEASCRNCHTALTAGLFCPNCGQKRPDSAQAPRTPQRAASAARRV
ncbi:unnamed protein product [Effrenium voratum]|uniref:Uncharacterized protein n=1 Tax=Effrenium voratum TaxID=2562239 RepID=A0AA36MNX0_9DINO|nr:unnamed protein product [Effrenium voratum]CAJ1460996.1 unnamed protein product [Effrenium voratum]